MPNYIDLVGEYYPDSQVTSTGDPSVYNNLVWITTAISQEDLDLVYLSDYKANKIIEFSELAREDIVNGFDSSALGSPHLYASEPEDQLNLIGSVSSGVTMPYSCRAYTSGYQVVDVGGAKIGTDSTGFSNDTTQYSLEVQVDGSSSYLAIQGSDAQTFDSLITQMNLDADFSALATAAINNGNIEITSNSFGSSSTVNIVIGSLVSSLTGYVRVQTAVDGIDGIDNTKVFETHTNAQLMTVLNDGAVVKLTVLQKFNTKKEQILNAVDVAAVDAITW